MVLLSAIEPPETYTTSTIVIDADEYEEALRDPKVHAMWARADAYLERLVREGRFFL